MPRAETRHFGPKDYSEESVIQLPRGIPGFENETAFLLLQLPEQFPLVYLQSLATPGLCFVALPVFTVSPGYGLELAEEDAALLNVATWPRIGADVLCLTLIAVDEGGPTANLLAPVVVNIGTRMAAQCINLSQATDSESHRVAMTPRCEAVPA